ncbi:MAG: AraC family transcriptional regulator ligand-binding domain-containing protein [Chloroflexota bacterium]
MHPLIPAVSVKAALKGFEALGLDPKELLAPTGLSADQLDDPFTSVPDAAFAQIWMTAFGKFPDPTLPTQAGLVIPFSEFGMLDHLVKTADTLGEALHILNLFLWLVSIDISLEFTHNAGDWVWVKSLPTEPSSFISEEWTLAITHQRFSAHFDGYNIEEVRLSQSAELDPAMFEKYWEVPVKLESKHAGFKLGANVWDLPNQTANPLLKQTLRTVAEQVEIKQFEEAPLVYAIRTRLPQALEDGAFSAEDVAAELGLSKRTLQRQLSAENITFKELLDVYRQEQAFLLLQKGEQDMANIAYALGYNEQSSFNRAFKRWTGKTPSAWLAV